MYICTPIIDQKRALVEKNTLSALLRKQFHDEAALRRAEALDQQIAERQKQFAAAEIDRRAMLHEKRATRSLHVEEDVQYRKSLIHVRTLTSLVRVFFCVVSYYYCWDPQPPHTHFLMLF
jgi:hypothetical protein